MDVSLILWRNVVLAMMGLRLCPGRSQYGEVGGVVWMEGLASFMSPSIKPPRHKTLMIHYKRYEIASLLSI